jgi:hypothetical protein
VIGIGPVTRDVAAVSCECPTQSTAVLRISCFQPSCKATFACCLSGVMQVYSFACSASLMLSPALFYHLQTIVLLKVQSSLSSK